MASALPRTGPVLPAAGLLRRSPALADARRLPPVRRLRPGPRELPPESRIVLRHGVVAVRD